MQPPNIVPIFLKTFIFQLFAFYTKNIHNYLFVHETDLINDYQLELALSLNFLSISY